MNNNKLFVGNLSFKLNEEDVKGLFAEHGNVVSVSMPIDSATGKKRGFAFVEMGSQEEAEAAIKALNGHTLETRQITVSISRPKPNGGGGGGGGFRGGSRGGGGGGGYRDRDRNAY
ncbi:MAG TPA: RNA-binding protein [Candidatus Obscuribacterales bacterium]